MALSLHDRENSLRTARRYHAIAAIVDEFLQTLASDPDTWAGSRPG